MKRTIILSLAGVVGAALVISHVAAADPDPAPPLPEPPAAKGPPPPARSAKDCGGAIKLAARATGMDIGGRVSAVMVLSK